MFCEGRGAVWRLAGNRGMDWITKMALGDRRNYDGNHPAGAVPRCSARNPEAA